MKEYQPENSYARCVAYVPGQICAQGLKPFVIEFHKFIIINQYVVIVADFEQIPCTFLLNQWHFLDLKKLMTLLFVIELMFEI